MTKLKQLRTKKNLSQKDLAEKAGINVRTLQQYEQGTRDLNKAEALTVLKLAFVLNCNPYELINFRGEI